MPYHNRQWNVKDVGSPEELAETIVSSSSWCGCVGFRCQGILWLNDSSCGGNIQEWAVIRERDGRQCESNSVGWIDTKDAKAEIIEYQKLYHGGAPPQFGEGNYLEAGALEHLVPCGLCA